MNGPLAGRVVSLDLWGTLISDGDRDAASRWRSTEFARVLRASGHDVQADYVHKVLGRVRADIRARQDATGWQPTGHAQVSAMLTALGVTLGEPARAALISVHTHAVLRACPVAMPGAHAALRAIKESGARLVLTANTLATPGTVHRQILDGIDLLRVFDDLLFSADIGVAKPDPAVFGLVADRAQAPVAAVIHVGNDPRTDVAAARAAGAGAILYDPHHQHRGQPQAPAIAHLDDLFPVLSTLRPHAA